MKQNVFKRLTAIACLLLGFNATAHDFEVDGIFYNITSSDDLCTVEVTYEGNSPSSATYSGTVVIPETVTHDDVVYTVTAIGNTAFAGNRNLESITLHEQIMYIGVYAFTNSGITSINIPKSVTCLGDYAFYGCSNLTTINVDSENPHYLSANGVLFDKERTELICFPSAKEADSYTVPSTVTEIADFAFFYTIVKSVTLPSGLTSIGYAAFYGNSNISTIVIPSTVTSIDESAFRLMPKLSAINVNTANTSYSSQNGVLYNKDKTTLITFPQGKTDNNFTVPESVTLIEHFAFENNSNLNHINLPENLLTIGYYAFFNCPLSDITFPNALTYIGDCAFYNNNFTSITIPSNITSIVTYAFTNCKQLQTVIIEGTPSLGAYCFAGCSNLSSVVVNSETPPEADSYTFTNISENAILYVPSEKAKENYIAETGWTGFSGYIINYMKADDVTTFKGKSVTLPVEMINEPEMTGFQADIYLPEGVTCNGITLTDRASDHTLSQATQSDGAIRILSYSMTLAPYSGNNGALFNLDLSVSDEVTATELEVKLSNIKITSVDVVEYDAPAFSTKINVESYITGDANGNGDVTVTDVVAVANYILGTEIDGFVEAAADVNGSGDITVTDVIATVKLALAQTATTVSELSTVAERMLLSEETETEITNSVYFKDFTVVPGSETEVSMYMDHALAFSGFQADIYLPEGVTIKSMTLSSGRNNGHTFMTSEPAEGVTRVLSFSMSLTDFTGNSGDAIVDFTLSIDETFTGGTVKVANVECSTANAVAYKTDDTTAMISVDDPTGVENIITDNDATVEYYNLQGMKVDADNLNQGIYIKRCGNRTQKVLVK